MAWTEVGYSSSKSSTGGNSFRTSLQADYTISADKSTATVYGRIILGAKGNYVPFYQWTLSGNLSINNVSKYNSTNLRWPWAENHWNNGSITIAGTSYAKSTNFADTRTASNYAAMGTQSQTVSLTYGSAKTVPLSGGIYSPGGTNYLPTSGWMNASGNLTIPAQTAPSPGSATVTGVTVTTTSATVSGSIGSPYTEVQYSRGGSSWQSSNTFTGLHPNTSYDFYIRGRNHNSSWVTSSKYSKTTLTPSLPTYTVNFDSIARTSARMVINITENPDNYWMVHYYNTSDGWVGKTARSTGTTYYTWSGLNANTTYTYYTRVGALNASGADTNVQGRVSRGVTTIGNAPTITYISIGNITSTSAQLSWGYSFDTNASYASMTLQYGTTTSYGSSIGNTNMTGLRSNTTYYYRVRVTDNYGRTSAWSTGSFRTDYPTQQITSLLGEEATEDSLTVSVNVANPSWLTNVTCWLYEEDGTTLVTTQTKTSNIVAKNNFLFENLNAGTEYVIKARITTLAQTSGGYNSSIVSLIMATVDATPVSIVRSDGTIEKHKMYVMGRGNIYNPSRMTWQNGYYATGTTGIDISTLLTQSTSIDGGAASTQSFIEILPNISYTIKNNEEDINFIIHGTDNNNIVTTVGYQLHAGQTYEYTGTSATTRLWISIASDNNPMINYTTAPYYKMNIFRTIEKTLIPKDNIIKISDKIRYIDIIQAGSSVNANSHIVALKVFDLNGNDIALNKTATMIKGLSASNLDRITNGNTDTDNYATITPKNANNLETIVRVDLGQEYDNIDYVQLWRYYADGRTYHNTKIYGRRDSKGAKEICWKFQSYKIEGTYAETANGYKSHIIRERVVGIPIITSVLLTPNNSTSTINGTKITINADWTASVPPVLDSYISYRTDAILAANQGRIMKEEIGSLSNLSTMAKTNLVAAINEIWNSYSGSDIYNNVLNSLLNAILNK